MKGEGFLRISIFINTDAAFINTDATFINTDAAKVPTYGTIVPSAGHICAFQRAILQKGKYQLPYTISFPEQRYLPHLIITAKGA